MIKLDIWMTFPNGERIKCGEMLSTTPDARGAMQGAFRYSAGFSDHPDAFPLDPVRLPLTKEEFQASRPSGVHAVFEDALPDDWGRRLLIRKANLKREEQIVPRMLQELGGNGLGALSFWSKGHEPESRPSVDMIKLKALADAAYAYDAGKFVDEESLALLFRAASSPGGARPKALVVDLEDIHWVAKFPSAKDTMAMIPIEAATLNLARASGLNVPEVTVRQIGKRSVLLVKRFDITGCGGRRHMISGQALLGAEGYYNLGYSDLSDIVRKYSSRPSVDISALFRQMVFNAAVGNTDDHLKNVTMLHDDNGFFLSPAYDLLPDTADRREHVLYFETGHVCPDRQTLLRIARRWRVKQPERIIDGVLLAVSRWSSVFLQFNVPESDIQRLEPSIQHRLDRLVGSGLNNHL